MTDKEQIAMLREALETCRVHRGPPGERRWFDLDKVNAALAATAPSAQMQEKVDEKPHQMVADVDKFIAEFDDACNDSLSDAKVLKDCVRAFRKLKQARAALRSE